jgi:hypothetical protein
VTSTDTRSAPAEVVSRGWPDRLREKYARGSTNDPLEQVIAIAEGHQVEAVLIERRYVDPDYRSEHSRFYAATFREHPSFCDRLHFFTKDIPDDLNLSELRTDYRGYSVMRPASSNPVGRTMLVPPAELDDACVCVATEEVHPFGYPLQVTAMPFISQDEQYLRCAHAAQWMVLYHAHLAHGLARRLPEDIHDASKNGRLVGRQVPAEGLSPSQILRGLQTLQLSASMAVLPWEDKKKSRDMGNNSLFAMLCRYVNSSMPPIVVSNAHAWVVVAYTQSGSRSHDDTVLYRHDDSRGPYIKVVDPWKETQEHHRKWWLAIPPMPHRIYLSAERAEPIARFWLRDGLPALLDRFEASTADDLLTQPIPPEQFEAQRKVISALEKRIADGDVTLRTYAVRSHLFKAQADGRLPPQIADLYRRCHLPGHVWVVEAIDRNLATSGEKCVLGETVIDPTTNHTSKPDESSRSALLAWHLSGMAFAYHPDFDDDVAVVFDAFEPYASGAPGWRWREVRSDGDG